MNWDAGSGRGREGAHRGGDQQKRSSGTPKSKLYRVLEKNRRKWPKPVCTSESHKQGRGDMRSRGMVMRARPFQPGLSPLLCCYTLLSNPVIQLLSSSAQCSLRNGVATVMETIWLWRKSDLGFKSSVRAPSQCETLCSFAVKWAHRDLPFRGLRKTTVDHVRQTHSAVPGTGQTLNEGLSLRPLRGSLSQGFVLTPVWVE